jgi:hypothetical protein
LAVRGLTWKQLDKAMNISDPCMGDRTGGTEHRMPQLLAQAFVVFTLAVGVPFGVLILALAVTATLPVDWQFGSIPMVGLMIIETLPVGWVLSGLGCWMLGIHRSRNHETCRLLGRPLEDWGLIAVALGLLTVGAISCVAARTNRM